MSEWTPVAIPTKIVDEVKDVLKKKPGFWLSPSEFVRDAVREKLAKCTAEADPIATTTGA